MRPEEAIPNYLALRRSLGFKLRGAESLLKNFATYLRDADTEYVTAEIAVRWALGNGNLLPATSAQRLSAVRQFARYLASIDPRTEIPGKDLIPARTKRIQPYIYSDAEILSLMEAAVRMGPDGALRPHSYSTFFGLLATTGLRLNEAISLQRQDVDLERALLEIRESKCRKSRLVPFDASTSLALKEYAKIRDEHQPKPKCSNFFLAEQGGPLRDWRVRYNFIRLALRTGLRQSISCGPRLHDFRHSFAVKTLVRWYRAGVDVEQRMPYLSAYLGHVHTSDTYWYISGCPELLGLAGARIEKTIGGIL